MLHQKDFYKVPEVRERIANYCGGTHEDPQTFSCEYLVGYGEYLMGREKEFVSTPTESFNWILDSGLDCFRSNWDREATLGVLDVEYFNNDYPGEVYLHPLRCFQKIEAVHQAIEAIYRQYEIPHITLMTGQGYHYVMKITKGSETDIALQNIGVVIDTVAAKYAHPTGRRHRYVSLQHGKSFDGMGRIMTFLAHQIIRQGAENPNIHLPIVLTDVAIGPGQNGIREAISIDLSMYGDPIYMRDIRCPFSSHQKHKVQKWKVGNDISNRIPVAVTLPRTGQSLEEMIALRRHFQNSANYAKDCSTEIPEANESAMKLIKDYLSSKLFEFHSKFDMGWHDPWYDWKKTYDLFDLSSLPPCVSLCLKQPNPNILKPTNLQTLSRILYQKGWHPKDIAGLVRSKLERDYGWGGEWEKYDAAGRADFYVRLFCGLIADKLDHFSDHNCVSHKEKGYCVKPWCGYNLSDMC